MLELVQSEFMDFFCIPANKTVPQQNGAAIAVKKCEILSPEKSSSTQEQQQPLNQILTNEIILANTKEKTPMCLVNELARFNKVSDANLKFSKNLKEIQFFSCF